MDSNDIRKKIKELRKSLPSKTLKELSEKIFEKVKTLDFKDKENIFIYKSFNGEVETESIIEHFLSENKTLSFPVINGENMVAGIPIGEDEIRSKFGTLEPKNHIVMNKVDVCFLPLLACDLEFNRLGYGKGYYDKFLKDKECLKIGLCYDFQVVEKIESKPWDVPLDIIITETKIIKREK